MADSPSSTPPPPSSTAASSSAIASGSGSPSAAPPSEPRRGLGRTTPPPPKWPRPEYIAALVLGIALVGVQIFFFRRHFAASRAAETAAVDAGAAEPVAAVDAGPAALPPVVVTDLRVVECHDPGPRRTPPEECDHVPGLEQAFVKAIEQNASCMPASVGGGAVTYTLDASFLRKRTPYYVSAPRDGRTLKAPKAVNGCVAAIKRALGATALEGLAHGHARYKLSATATYQVPSDSAAAALR